MTNTPVSHPVLRLRARPTNGRQTSTSLLGLKLIRGPRLSGFSGISHSSETQFPLIVLGGAAWTPLASSAGRPALKATQESPGHVVQTLPPDPPSTWFTSHLGGEEAGSRLDCPANGESSHGNLKPEGVEVSAKASVKCAS